MYELTDLDYPIERVSFDIEKIDETRAHLASVLPASLARLSIPQLETGEVRTSEELCANLNFAKIAEVTKEASVQAVNRAEVSVRREVAPNPDWIKGWRYPQYKFEMCKRLPSNISGALLQATVSESLTDAGYPLETLNQKRARATKFLGAGIGGILISDVVLLKLGAEGLGVNLLSNVTGYMVATSSLRRLTNGTRHADRSGVEVVYHQQLKSPGVMSKLHGAVQAAPSFAPQDPFYVEAQKA